MNTKSLLILLVGLFTFSNQAISQKFGHINSANLLIEMAEVKQAEIELADYQKTLITVGEEMVKAFKVTYDKYILEANEGTLSAIKMKQREGELQAENQNIQNYEAQVQQLLAKNY